MNEHFLSWSPKTQRPEKGVLSPESPNPQLLSSLLRKQDVHRASGGNSSSQWEDCHLWGPQRDERHEGWSEGREEDTALQQPWEVKDHFRAILAPACAIAKQARVAWAEAVRGARRETSAGFCSPIWYLHFESPPLVRSSKAVHPQDTPSIYYLEKVPDTSKVCCVKTSGSALKFQTRFL